MDATDILFGSVNVMFVYDKRFRYDMEGVYILLREVPYNLPEQGSTYLIRLL